MGEINGTTWIILLVLAIGSIFLVFGGEDLMPGVFDGIGNSSDTAIGKAFNYVTGK
jgi:TM2 domain-containing membrane protein YozV